MFIRFLVIFCIFTSTTLASEFSVEYGQYRYSVQFNEKYIKIEGKHLSRIINKNKCNQDIFEKFRKKISGSVNFRDIRINPASQSVKVTTGDIVNHLPAKSQGGKYFLTLPEEFKTIQIQEKLKCR